jgi:hypothetical protein
MPNPKNIEPHKMKKGTTLNPNGRPRKYVSLLKDQGYKRSEINDTIQAMMAMDMVELKEVYDNPRATILEKTIANAMRKSLEKGTLYSLETLLSRVFGQPKQEVEQTIIEKPIFNSINLDVQGDDSAT